MIVPAKNVEAYHMLYQIENHLREIIKELPYNATLLDLIQAAERIPQRTITDEAIRKLYWVVEVRNKVCHMHPINKREYEVLLDCWMYLKDY